MYYPDNKEYITFLFSLLDEFAEAKQTVVSRGRPESPFGCVLTRLLCGDDAKADQPDSGTTSLVIHASDPT